MNINYRILSKDDEQHSLVIRYWTNIISEESLATSVDYKGNIEVDGNGHPLRCRTDYNLTLYGLNRPTDVELHNLAMRSAPVSFFKLLELRKIDPQKLDLSAVNDLIGIDKTFEVSDTPNSNTANNNKSSNVYGV